MAPALIALAAQVGAPLIEKVLARRIGAGNAALAREVVGAIAETAGILPGEVERAAEADPDRIGRAMREVEPNLPEVIALHEAEAAARMELFRIEQDEPLWVRAWRPLGMYGLGVLWFWNLIILHVANAIWKTALPPTDLSVLMQISALYMSLYMGGHTVKDLAEKWKEKT